VRDEEVLPAAAHLHREPQRRAGKAAGRRTASLELFNEALWAQDPYAVAKTGFEKSRPWFE
jgi:hypothetical protein